MRKLIFFILLLLPFIFIIFNILFQRNYITNYYMEINVIDNDLNIRELKYLKENYNGYRDCYNISNNYNYNGTASDLLYNSIYMPSDITFNNIGLIKNHIFKNYNLINDNIIDSINNIYKYDNNICVNNYNNYNYGYYLDYTLHNVVVSHNDINEIYIDLFKNYDMDIYNLEIHVNMDSNSKLYVIGSSNNIKKTDNGYIIKISKLSNNISLRILNDDLIDTYKTTNYNMLDKIIDLENNRLEKYDINYYLIINIVLILLYLFFIFLSILDILDDKISHKYNRELPSDECIGMVNYILKGYVSLLDFYSVMLSLFDKKVLTLEEVDNDYLIKYNKMSNINRLESCVLGAVLNKEVNKLSDIVDYSYSSQTFKNCYYNFTKEVKKIGISKNYFDKSRKFTYDNLFFPLLSFIIAVILNSKILGIISIILIILEFYYNNFVVVKCNNIELRDKLIGLKKYIRDFSNLDSKELPDIYVRGKYLIYAVSFGISSNIIDKLNLNTNFIDRIVVNRINTMPKTIRLIKKYRNR